MSGGEQDDEPEAQGKALRPIAEARQVKGFKISHEGVKGVLGAHSIIV